MASLTDRITALASAIVASVNARVKKTGDVMTGPLTIPSGSAASPSMAWGTGGGIFKSSGTTWALVDASGNVLMTLAGAPTVNGGGYNGYRFTTDTTGFTNNFYKARGTLAAPSAIAAGDSLYQLNIQGYGATAYKTGGRLWLANIEAGSANGGNDPSDTGGHGSEWQSYTVPINGTSTSITLSWGYSTGIKYKGTVIVDSFGGLVPKNTNLTTGQTYFSAVGGLYWWTNGLGNLVTYDGTGIRKLSVDLQVVATDANATIHCFTNGEEIYHSGVLTADRTYTFAADTYTPRFARFRLTRVGVDSHILNCVNGGPAGGSWRVYSGQYLEIMFNGTDWILIGLGYVNNGGRPSTITANADYTPTASLMGVDAQFFWDSVQTVVRNFILPVDGTQVDGQEARVTREAVSTGAFALNVYNGSTSGTLLKALNTSTWADFLFNAATGAWKLTAYGSL